jgi:2-methylcitrate dehydratase PrpD
VHSLIDNVIGMQRKEALKPEEVREIECRVHPSRIAYLDRPQARTSLEAQFSIQYCVATALANGRVGLGQFSEVGLAQPATRSLMPKVRITPAEDFAGFASEVIVRKLDGREVSSRLPEPRGSKSSPFTEDEMVRKFIDCAMEIMSAAQAEKAAAALMSLDTQDDVASVLSTLVPID